MYIYIYICICYNTLRVLYEIYKHQTRGPLAQGRGDYKSDIARVVVLYFTKYKSFVDV